MSEIQPTIPAAIRLSRVETTLATQEANAIQLICQAQPENTPYIIFYLKIQDVFDALDTLPEEGVDSIPQLSAESISRAQQAILDIEVSGTTVGIKTTPNPEASPAAARVSVETIQAINTVLQTKLSAPAVTDKLARARNDKAKLAIYRNTLAESVKDVFSIIEGKPTSCDKSLNPSVIPANPSIKRGETLASLTINGPHLERVKFFDIPEGLMSTTDPKTEVEVKKDPTSGNVVLVLKNLKAASTYTATKDEPIILKDAAGKELGRFTVKVIVEQSTSKPTAEEPLATKLLSVRGMDWFNRYFKNSDNLSLAQRIGPHANLSAAGVQAGGAVTPRGEGRVNAGNRDLTGNLDPYFVARAGVNSEIFQPPLQKIAREKLALNTTQQVWTNPITGELNDIPDGSEAEVKLDKTGLTPKASLSLNVFGVWNPTLSLAGKFFKSNDISLHPVSDRYWRDGFSPFAPDQARKDVAGVTIAPQPLRTSLFFQPKQENEWVGFTLGIFNPTFNATLNPTQLNRKPGFDYLPDAQIEPNLNIWEIIAGTNNKQFLLMGSSHSYVAPGLSLYKQYSQAETVTTDPVDCSSKDCPGAPQTNRTGDQDTDARSRLNLFSQEKLRFFGDNRLRFDWHFNDSLDVGVFGLLGGETSKSETINHTESAGLIAPQLLKGWDLTLHPEVGVQVGGHYTWGNFQIIPAIGAHKTLIGMHDESQLVRPQPYYPTDEFYGKLAGSVGLNQPSWLNASLGGVIKAGVSNDPFGQGYPTRDITETLRRSRYPNFNVSGLLTLSLSLAAPELSASTRAADNKLLVENAKRPTYSQPGDK